MSPAQRSVYNQQTLRAKIFLTFEQSGIGETLAKHLHSLEYKVALSGRRIAEGEANAASLDPDGETAIFVPCDVSSYTSQSKLFQAVWDKWGHMDVLIANAGLVDRDSKYNFRRRDAPVTELPPEPDTSCIDIDLKGVIYGTALATHFMRHNPGNQGGKIIITGSMIGIHPCPTFPEYCAAKAGVVQYMRSMAPLLKSKDNVAMNTVLPGAVDTSAMPDFAEAFLPEHLTLPECLLSAYDLFLDDDANEKVGVAVETGHDKLYTYDVPEYKSGAVAERNTKVYEPWFELIHGEKSKLHSALQGPQFSKNL